MSKRTLDQFFAPKAKKVREAEELQGDNETGRLFASDTSLDTSTVTNVALPSKGSDSVNDHHPKQEDGRPQPKSSHATYPWPVPHLPADIITALDSELPPVGKTINDKPDLDLLYLRPLFPRPTANQIFRFLREELFFYRVEYSIKRGPTETKIRTPRFTTVFGLDETSLFSDEGTPLDASSRNPVPERYKGCVPRPIPQCLDVLRKYTETVTDSTFNFCLVNYYATGDDSISYHSDDEHFLGPLPTIASLSLGGTRDFLMKHKDAQNRDEKPLKMALESGDMVVMRRKTQARWLHSIPKRKGREGPSGRINITFRKAMVKGGTENYYNYNVGKGPPYKWSNAEKKMVLYTR